MAGTNSITLRYSDEEIISTYHRIKAKDEAFEHGKIIAILKTTLMTPVIAVVMIGGKTVIVREDKTPIFMTYSDLLMARPFKD